MNKIKQGYEESVCVQISVPGRRGKSIIVTLDRIVELLTQIRDEIMTLRVRLTEQSDE